ncbi:cell adhesion molecule 1-like [Physella acuta]|uniref:cell adhesion molecule 1-like n=1 Tax=Physella acuta TaxID=109671 RepID=UPI0027DBABA7|nr:cell adhesion molecule 1-like [Physella acuta]
MIIQNTQCSDEGTYFCSVTYINTETGSSSFKNNSTPLYIKVPPKSPSFASGASQNGVPEGSLANITCNANWGRPGKGSIQWKYYSNGVEVTASINPQVTTKSVSLQSGDDPCTERWESRTSLVANRTFQNLSLACYVVNTDFPVTQPDCTSVNFCSQTDPISILYGVSDITVNSAPQSMSYEGGTTTLTCYADGNPKPSYTWTKEDDVNRTLTGIQDGDVSKLVLTNLRLDQDDGTYNCTASNVVLGVSYSTSREVNVNVVATTTTKATTKTSTTARTSTSVTTAPGGASPESQSADNSQTNTIIIAVCVSVGCVIIIVLIIVGVVCWRKRQPKKTIEEPPEKPYNNHTNLSFQHAQPDLVADEKKFNNPSLNSSFDQKHEDGLLYADLTYDNRPRSRKPMAITETSSDYSSDIQMPQV